MTTSAPPQPANRLYFGSVKIIESLKPHEERTGWNLFDELQPIGLMSKPQVTCEYTAVKTAQELRVRLEEIRDEVRNTGRPPILQLETHGNHNGIGLASDEFVPWATLRPWLTEINEATRLNLLVLLSACNGADLVQVVQPTERAAVLALIGPNRVMYPPELQKASIAFYRTLFARDDARTAWKAMNETLDPDLAKATFSVFLAKANFRYIMHHYLKTHCTEEALAAREHPIEIQAAKAGVPRWFIEKQRPVLRAYMRDFQPQYSKFKEHYFFTDLFPENASKFPVTLEDCWRSPTD